jgi:hypothetical protein
MSDERTCPYCRNGRFLVLTNMWFDVKRQLPGVEGSRNVPGKWKVNLTICTGCARTEWFTLNGEELAANVPEAQFLGTR